ncbi:MAG TPA: AAA family ATPase [Candidatus Altiarchaeales archaeon]|nr:AAA family ATPase [Candidatus Altiarchaeales archaeon]
MFIEENAESLMDKNVEDLLSKELSDRRIFLDKRVLSPHYVPKELPHREKEITDVTRTIAPVLRNEKPSNLFIYGKTGTGKTCVVKYVMRKLNEFVQDPKKNINNAVVRSVYVNCKIRDSKYKVLLKVLEDPSLNDPTLKDVPLKDRAHSKGLMGIEPSELYDRLFNVVEKNGMNLIIILDEIDMVRKGLDDLMYILTRINDDLSSGNVSIIGMSNDMRVMRRMDPRSKSTLCEEEMIFKPYNALQLRSILKQRVEKGFQPGVIDDAIISRIAAFAAQDGDARYALRLLQKAGEIAVEKNSSKVLQEHVEEAKKRVEEDIIAEAISTLPEHHQVVLYALSLLVSCGGFYRRLNDVGDGDFLTGEVYEAYENCCKKLGLRPRTTRQFSDYINELEMLGLIITRSSGKGQRGNTRFIRLGYSPKEVKKIVEKSLGISTI